MSVVTLEGQIVHYEVLGRGKPILFLHGWVGSWRYWIPTMQAISTQYRAYALDFWGYGDTTKKTEYYTLQSQIGLISQFLDYMGIVKIAIVGHGLGANVGLVFASRFPQLVDRLMFSGLPLGLYSLNPRFWSSPVPELTDWLLGRLPNMDAARLEAVKADSQALLSSLEYLKNLDSCEVLRDLNIPNLLVFGQNDSAVISPSIEILENLPELSHFVIFEQSGHFPMVDENSKFNRLLSDFLLLNPGESPRQLQVKEEWKRRIR